METRRLTKLITRKTFCLYCDCKLVSQEKQIGYKLNKKQFSCLNCAIEKNFISDQQIIKFLKSKITEVRIPQWKIEEGRVRY